MSNERQREIGRWIKETSPKGDMPQQEFKMVLTMLLERGMAKDRAVAQATASVRDRHPGFTPVEQPPS